MNKEIKIFMHIPGLPFHGKTIEEGKSLGGSESAGYYIAKELAKLNCDVTVFSNITPQEQGVYEGVSYLGIGNITKECQWGENFIQIAQKVPHDVLIAQRMPHFFTQNFASKLNLWWSHDLSLKRTFPLMQSQLWNIDQILAVSEWHKNQIHEVYNIKKEYISVLRNGVDFDHYQDILDAHTKFQSKTLIFSSRPERGLENLVKENGIMEILYKLDPDIHLIVTSYDHIAPEMQAYYKMLWQRCQALPNVTLYQPQSKQQLAIIEQSATAQIYPTDFEDTSCITAMNAQKAGNVFISQKTGALEETLENGGYIFIDKKESGEVDLEKFAKVVYALTQNKKEYLELFQKAKKKGEIYSWEASARNLKALILKLFKQNTQDNERVIKHFRYNSDIKAASLKDINVLLDYDKVLNRKEEHYNEVAQYHIDIQNQHQLGNDTWHLNMPRIQPLIPILKKLKSGSNVLDYGCCVGQTIVSLAKMFPNINFTGTDLTKKQLSIGSAYIKEHNIKNVKFIDIEMFQEKASFDIVICAEVLEHVFNTEEFIFKLESLCMPGTGILYFTTPYGPYEDAPRINNAHLSLEHLHNFEQTDLEEMFKDKKEFALKFIPQNVNNKGYLLGNFVFYYTMKDKPEQINSIKYERKCLFQKPQETVSVCIITKAESYTLGETLSSISSIADEIIIGVDGEKGPVYDAIDNFNKLNIKIKSIKSPREIGFDEARNETIKEATKDWILWIDSDEVLQWPERLIKYLRNNQYDSYAIAQHHFSAEPAGLIQTDFPCRLFRNKRGIKFFGVVHEHPEVALNKGPGHSCIIPQSDVCICHNGYETEDIRRIRFQRNWPLMCLDRKKYPNRELGKFLWIRDLSHMNHFEYGQTGQFTKQMRQRALEVIELWKELVKEKKTRLIYDSLQYYNQCVDFLTGGQNIEYDFGLKANNKLIGDNSNTNVHVARVKFLNIEDVKLFSNSIIDDKLSMFESKYI